MKKCSVCKEEKPYSEFYTNVTKKDGYGSFCKDCMKRHAKTIYKRNRRYISEFKLKSKCLFCGEDHPSCLIFHHRDPSKKEFNISQASAKSIKRIKAEMKKCDILCYNCHKKLHYEDNKPV